MVSGLKVVNVSTQLPPCPCGCKHVRHIHASLGNRIAASGVVHHLGVDDNASRFFKMDRLSTQDPHVEGHDMDDTELLFSMACYDESPQCGNGERLPLPKTLKWESFLQTDAICAASAALTPEAMHEFALERSLFCPVATTSCPEHGSFCRYGDRVVLAKRVAATDAERGDGDGGGSGSGTLQLYAFDVVGTAPAIGIMVATARVDLPELGLQCNEPIFVTESNVLLVERGRHWGNPALAEQARDDFRALERRLWDSHAPAAAVTG